MSLRGRNLVRADYGTAHNSARYEHFWSGAQAAPAISESAELKTQKMASD
jgi:hypothetical protein